MKADGLWTDITELHALKERLPKLIVEAKMKTRR
jgi:hypothetical protein